jgi:hypothetical protein
VAGPILLEMRTDTMSRLANRPGFASKLLHSSKMPAFTLYGCRGSTNTDRVRLTLAEGGFTDYELVLLNLQKGEQKVSGLFFSKDDKASFCASKLRMSTSFQMIYRSSNICPPAYRPRSLLDLTPFYLVQRTCQTSSMG